MYQLAREKKRARGQSILELLIAAGIFAVLLSVVSVTLIDGYVSTLAAEQNSTALPLAEEGLEAARSIRDSNWDDLVIGNHGLAVSSSRWIFQGTEEDLSAKLNQGKRIVIVEDAGADRKLVRSRVLWRTGSRDNQIELVTYLHNWQKETLPPQADWLLVDTTNAKLSANQRQLNGLVFSNTGTSAIIIDRITVSWTNSQLIEQITFAGTDVWTRKGPGTPTGRQPSGTEIDIQDFTISAGSTVSPTAFVFNGKMKGAVFDIIFTMKDGSQKIVENIVPQ